MCAFFLFNFTLLYKVFCLQSNHSLLTACRWLYPRKDSNAAKEAIVQGKKLVPSKKQNWAPSKENPSGISSCVAFVQHATTQLDGADTLQMGTSSNMRDSDTTDARIEAQHHEIPAETIPPSENMANHNTDIAQYSFSMPLVNVTDSVARIAVVVYDDPIITPVIPLEVSHFTAAQDATVNPTLEKNMDFMNNWLKQVAVNDVPFSPVISKSQKKKLNKIKANYQTRSQGPLPTPQ